MQKDVKITGMQKNPYPYIAACDIYVQPSYEESYGNTMVEAQLLMKPVVTTATLGGQKLVKTGINGIVSEISAESLARAIERLLIDKSLFDEVNENLVAYDYSDEYIKYKKRWQNLLEG